MSTPTKSPAGFLEAAPLFRGLGTLTGLMASAGTLLTLGISLLICAEILMRGVFNQPITGMTEFVSLCIVPIMFLTLPAVVFTGKLFRVEIFTGPWNSENPRHAFYGLFHSFAFLAIVAIVGQWAYSEAVKAWVTNDYSGVAGAYEIPTWPFRWTVVAGLFAVAITCVAMILRDGRLLWAGRRDLHTILLAPRPLLFVGGLALFALTVALLPYNPLLIGSVFIGWLFVLLALGFPIATILLGLSAIGIYLIRENFRITEVTMGIAMTKSIGTFEYAVIPLFVTMGLVLDRSKLGEDAFHVAAHFLRRARGGLAIATVLANAVFASVVGSSIASAAVFSRVAVNPMMDHGFSLRRALGTVAGSSVLGMLIPPSLLLIVYGLIAEQSIGQLFVAAIIPGLILAGLFAVLAYLLAPKQSDREYVSTSDEGYATLGTSEILAKIGPIALLVATILGGIYTGWFTPTEAAGVGLILSVVIAFARGSMGIKLFFRTAFEAGLISAAMLLLMAAAGSYTRLVAFAQLPMALNQWLVATSPDYYTLMAIFVLVVLALGAVLDSVSIILVMTPIILPMVRQFGADPVWFGVLLVVSVEIGLLTPPFGMSAYTVREVLSDLGVKLSDIFLGAFPFVLMMLLMVVLLILLPSLATVLL